MARYSEDTEKQLADLQAREHALRQLVASAGWRELVSQCEGAITTRRQGAFGKLASIRSMEDMFMVAGLGSETAGMQYVLALPHTILLDLKRAIEEVVIARRENDDNGS